MFVFLDYCVWIWCLCVISGVHPTFLPSYIFEDKITSTIGGYYLFCFVWGYMAGVNGLAGHELIHKRESYNKILGMLTFSKLFYSHFLLEHSSGHHRNVATPLDSATARLGENFYAFSLRSAIGGHVNTWNREVSRIETKFEGKKVPMTTIILHNKMTWFACLHLGIIAIILTVFGIRALVF